MDSRLQIDPYTVMKFNSGTSLSVQIGGTLDVYGTPTAPVIMTTVNDDSVAPILATSTGTPGIGSWSGIQYQAASLGTISDAQVRYANNALEITAASPTITNFTATEFGFIGLYLRTFAANQIANPTVTNIVLTTSDTFNYPIYMTSSTADATQVIAPVINGTSITTASTSTSAGAIHLTGIGVNPSISNMTINGGGYNLYATNNASGVFTNNIFNAANAESIYLINNANGVISIDSTNTITNAPAPYAMNQVFPSADIYASIGAGVIDTYSVHLSGNFNAANSILTPDPLGTGSSAYLVAGSITVNNGSRLQIDPYTVMKFNSGTSLSVQIGGTLDVYGTPTAPVIMTTVNDDSVAPILATSTGTPGIGSWSGIQYQAASLGTISDAQVRYANNALEITAASPTITNFTATEFGFIGLYLRTFAANQIANPTVTNIVLTTSDTFNYPIYMTSSTADATQVIAPVINGTSITTASTSTSAGAIHLTGIGVNPSISNMTINGGGYNLYATNNASGVFTNNTFNAATASAIYLINGATPNINGTNIVQNTNAAYQLANQLLPTSVSPSLGINGTNVADPYTLRITGTLPASGTDYVMNPDPLGIGSSVYQIAGGNFNVGSGARLVINAGTIIKAVANLLTVNNGGTLDIYGTAVSPVTFTSIHDDSVGGDSNGNGVVTTPAMRQGVSLDYRAGSLGSISFLKAFYADSFTIRAPIPMNDVTRFNGGFDMKFTGVMNQTVSNLHIDHVGIGGGSALTISGVGTNPIFTGLNTVDKYSSTHEAVVVSNGANPTLRNFTVDHHGANQPAFVISGITTTGLYENNIFQNASEAVRVDTGASPILSNNIMRNSGTGVYMSVWFNTVAAKAGNVTLRDNNIVNNGIGIDITNTTSALIEHNLIRSNSTAGIQVGGLNTASGIVIRNNLIGENGQGIAVLQDATLGTDTYANIEYNTIGNNLSAGVLADTYTNVGLRYNIISGNINDVASTSLALTPHYNLTSDLSLPTTAPSTDIYANPEVIGSAYLSDGSGLNGNTALASPAINAGADTTLAIAGLTTTPYAQATLPDAGALDLGYHHSTPAPVVNATNTVVAVSPAVVNVNGASITIIVTPKGALGNIIGAGVFIDNVVASQTGSVNGTFGSPIIDLGDGSYKIIYQNTLLTGADTLNISVNGIALPVVNLTW
ncbi:MAG: right-handed parallel beta-helix repeat-containing protein [Ghiorsea sp.]|nr:right-handed parallel beta-helix repeat-containing protein [Ghiorsea sp.]